MCELDERFRVYLQAASHSDTARQLIRDKTIRGLKETPGLLRSIKAAAQSATLDDKPSTRIFIEGSDIRIYFEKIVRGLYFHHYSQPFPGTFVSSCSHISSHGSDFRRAVLVYHAISDSLVLGTSAHPDIFRYDHVRVLEAEGIGAFFRLTFYGDITVFVVGTHENA